MRLPSGAIRGVYCHWDGYPSGVGMVLENHYKDSSKLEQLLKLGDLSELAPTLGTTVAYHRDRGEELSSNWVCPSSEGLVAVMDQYGAEYAYVFEGGAWEVFPVKAADKQTNT